MPRSGLQGLPLEGPRRAVCPCSPQVQRPLEHSAAQPPGDVVGERHHDQGAGTQTNGADTRTKTIVADTETKITDTIPNAMTAIGKANPSGQATSPKNTLKHLATNHATTVGTNPVIARKVEVRNGGKIVDIREGTNEEAMDTSQIQNQKSPLAGGNRIKLGNPRIKLGNPHRNEFQNLQNRQLHKHRHNIRGLSTLGIRTVQQGREIRIVTS